MMSVTKVGDGGLRIIDEIRKKVVPMRPAWIAALFLALLWPSGTPAATPKSMQVIVEQGNGGPEVLSLRVAPVLVPATGEVLIRVYAASVNPADTKIRRGLLFQVTQPIVPGMDVAGVIEKVGAGVRNLKPGEPVWAVIGRTAPDSPRGLNGGYAEFVIVSAARVMPKPRRMTYAQAAGVGVAGLAAARYLEPLKLGPGKTLLITGVAGGVGSAAAQIAKAEGARVIGTATAAHNEYLRSIGVDRVIDYSAGPFEEEVHAVDAVFDTRGGDTLVRSLKTLRPGGAMVSVVDERPPELCATLQVRCLAPVPAGEEGTGAWLRKVNHYAATGQLTIKVDRLFPLALAGAAQQYSEQGHVEGKVVLAVDDARANSR